MFWDLNLLEPSGPVQARNGIALPLLAYNLSPSCGYVVSRLEVVSCQMGSRSTLRISVKETILLSLSIPAVEIMNSHKNNLTKFQL